MLYVSSSCLRNKYISETIMQLAESGIRNIELSGGTDYYPGLREDVARLKAGYGLNYACHAYFPPPEEPVVVNLASCDDDIYRKSISHYENCIEFMKKIECRTLSVHAGFLVRVGVEEIGKGLKRTVIYDEEKAYDRFVSAYEYMDDLCRKEGITLYLENNVLDSRNYQEFQGNNYLMMTDCASIMAMKKKMDFNLLLDLGHLHVSAATLGLDYWKECMDLREEIRWFHISGNDGKTDQHLPVKKESTVLEILKDIYEEGTDITLETAGNVDEIKQSMLWVDRVLK